MIDSFEKIASLCHHIENEVHKIELGVKEKTEARAAALVNEFKKKIERREFNDVTPNADDVEEIRKYEVHEKKLKEVQVLAAELADACENLKIETPLPALEKQRRSPINCEHARNTLIQYAMKLFNSEEFIVHDRHAISKEVGCGYALVTQVFVALYKKGILEHNGNRRYSGYRIKRRPNYAVAQAALLASNVGN